MPCSKSVITQRMDTPIGIIKILLCSDGLHSIYQIDDTDELFEPDLTKQVELMDNAVTEPYLTHISAVLNWFKVYFLSPRNTQKLDLPTLCFSSCNSDFCWRVWTALAGHVLPQQTISYSKLAIIAGSTKGAAVAVGQAMAKNPFQIIVPCHRVLPKTGKVGYYARGKKNKVKSFLLEFEGCRVIE